MTPKRYLKIYNGLRVINKEEITKKDLQDVRDGLADSIVDLDNCIFFNPDENKWEPLEL